MAMPHSSSRNSSKQRLIDAAAKIVSTQGVQELTLEGVAAMAGVTKGGLIYHFKTKDDLLGALVQTMINELDQGSRTNAAKAGDTKGALLRALIDDTFDRSSEEKQLMSNLLAAASGYPHLLGPVRQLYNRTYSDFTQSGSQTGIAMVVVAALDGIAMLDLLNFHRFSKQQREAMRRTLHAMAREII